MCIYIQPSTKACKLKPPLAYLRVSFPSTSPARTGGCFFSSVVLAPHNSLVSKKMMTKPPKITTIATPAFSPSLKLQPGVSHGPAVGALVGSLVGALVGAVVGGLVSALIEPAVTPVAPAAWMLLVMALAVVDASLALICTADVESPGSISN